MISAEVITSQSSSKLPLTKMNLLLNTGGSTGLTGCPSALYVRRACLTSLPCGRTQWLSLQILWLRLQTKLFQNLTFLKTNSRKYRGLTMLINKLLKNGRRLNGNLFETLLQKTYLRLSSWKPKKTSGKVFVLHLDPKPNLKLSGKQSEKSKGKKTSSSLGHLKFNEKLITDKKQTANLLASTISHNPSSQQYSTQFQAIKKQKEKKTVIFTSNNTEDYNQPFSLLELKQALQKSNDSAVGPDDIHYKLLTNLPESSLTLLLSIFNSVWESGIFPPSSTIVAIPKPGKDSSDPNNYWPIDLTSCKTMERMVNKRLMWVLESKALLASEQCGFRKNRSTADQLVRFDTFIRNAFAKK